MRRRFGLSPDHMRLRIAIAALVALALLFASLADAEVIQRGGIRVAFDGQIIPKRLPRTGTAPVEVAVATKISSTDAKHQPQLTRIQLAINRNGHLDPIGLPVCEVTDIQPSTTAKALEACPGSKVGEGTFSATVALSKRLAFPASGKLVAFNGTYKGRPAILAHVYGTEPAPASYTIPFAVSRAKGTFGTTLKANLPPVKAGSGYITAIYLSLGKSFVSHGKHQSYFSASCPAPKGLSRAPFAFARASVSFQGGRTLGETLIRTCEAKG
jgi:hypothetical protein